MYSDYEYWMNCLDKGRFIAGTKMIQINNQNIFMKEVGEYLVTIKNRREENFLMSNSWSNTLFLHEERVRLIYNKKKCSNSNL